MFSLVCVFSCSCVCACFHFFVLCFLFLVHRVHCVHCALCPLVQVFISLLCVFLFLFLCVCCVCNVFRCSGCCCVLCSHRVQCVGVVISWEGVGCVLHVVIVCSGCYFVIVCVHVQHVKSGAFSECKKYREKSAFFLKNNYCFSCVYEKKAVPLQCENEGVTPY